MKLAKKYKADITVYKCDRYNEQTQNYEPYPFSCKTQYLGQKQVFSPRDEDIKDNIFRIFVGWAWDKMF